MNRRQAVPVFSGNAVGPGGASGVTPLCIAKSGIPFINISSGTMGNNGALSAITALPLTYSGGAYIWLPAGAIAAGVPAAAAWYWCVFSSTTAGTVYNSTYTSGVPTIGTTTAFSTTGPGAFTGDTGEVFGPQITVPAGSIGPNGDLQIFTSWNFTNSAGTKALRVRYSGTAGTQFMSSTGLTTQLGARALTEIQNRGLTNSQYGSTGFGATQSGSVISAIVAQSAVDTTAATTVVFSGQRNTATDNIILEAFKIDLNYGA